jgi:hypothetical protein
MSNDQILRWLIEFGSDWVVVGVTLRNTWAVRDIGLESAGQQGDLDSNLALYDGEPWKVRLTQQALDRLKDTYD